jgi:hypothetical protein
VLSVLFAFALRPIWQERRLRAATSQLIRAGVEVDSKYWQYDQQNFAMGFLDPEVLPVASWVKRFLGENSNVIRVSDVRQVKILEEVDFVEVARLLPQVKNLQELIIGDSVQDQTLGLLKPVISECGVPKIHLGGFREKRDFEIGWLADNERLESLTLYNVKNAISKISESKIFALRGLYIVNLSPKEVPNWDAFFDSPTVQHLNRLHLAYDASFDQAAADRIGDISRLKSLTLNGRSIGNLDFLTKLENLEGLSLIYLPVGDSEMLKLKSLSNLKKLLIRDRGGLKQSTIDALKKSLPKCRFDVQLNGDESSLLELSGSRSFSNFNLA